jgi:Cu(I)/Ag(I) efflux system membrane fusion protein
MDLVPTSRYGFADKPQPQPVSLHVPRSAVLLAGGNSVVYVETKPGVFEIRPVTVGPILRDKIVILEGLKAGESVATAGNFLIDSQMQLASKPSLIDPSRAIAQRKGPLVFENLDIAAVGGQTGKDLEALYAAYFQVQQALAADKKPPAAAAQALQQTAAKLAADPALPKPAAKLVQEVASKSGHLHHLELAEARKAFTPISLAVVALASQVRSEGAQGSFTHFFCPMVPGGGDWLQADSQMRNPFMGTEMLECGEKLHVFPPKGKAETPHKTHDAGSEKGGG